MTAETLSQFALRHSPPLVTIDDLEEALSPESVQALVEHGLGVVPVCIGVDTLLCCSSREALTLLVRLADEKARRLTSCLSTCTVVTSTNHSGRWWRVGLRTFVTAVIASRQLAT